MAKWTQSELDRRDAAMAGLCVVANGRSGVDEALRLWAEQEGRDVYIGRPKPDQRRNPLEPYGKWGNPFILPRVHTEQQQLYAVSFYRNNHLARKPVLVEEAKGLRGKMLICWCHPLPCHGDVLAEIANTQRFVCEAA